MVVYVKFGQVRWIKADRVAKRPRRKRQRWLVSGEVCKVETLVRPEICRTHRRIPRLRRSKLVWLPL